MCVHGPSAQFDVSEKEPHGAARQNNHAWCDGSKANDSKSSCGAGHRFSWPAEFERGAKMTNGYSPFAVPHSDTSSPISRNMAALVASARLAASASGA